MFDWLLRRQITDFEKHYDYDMGYAHRLLRASRGTFLRFALFSRLAQFRERVPAGPYFAARIAATLHEDCGPCTQLVIRMAEEAGVTSTTLRAIVADDEAALDADTALGLKFARAVLHNSADCAALHQQALARWGEQGAVSLALAIAYTRVYPTLKRGLGCAHACSRLVSAGQSIAPGAYKAISQHA